MGSMLNLMIPSVEIGLSTNNLDPMVEFYENFLALEFTGVMDFAGGTQRRYNLGKNTLKLVTFDELPTEASNSRGGRQAASIGYFTVVVTNLREVEAAFAASPYEIVAPLTELEVMPGFGFMYVADPDGNWLEISGQL